MELDKSNPVKIELDRWRQPDKLDGLRKRLTRLALLVGAGVLAVTVWRIGGWGGVTSGSRHHMPGSVAHVHAAFENNCSQCHVPWTRLAGHHGQSDIDQPSVPVEKKCQVCHAAAPHHPEKVGPQPIENCSTCHREHSGRHGSLLAIADRNCTICHGELTEHLLAGTSSAFKNIHAFPTDHPEFAVHESKQPDPGQVKFNHQLHLTPGMRLHSDSRPFTLGQIPPEYRDRYGPPDGAVDDAVALTCADCHRTRDQPLGAVAVGRAAAMSPITYEQHCAACHPNRLGSEGGEPLHLPHGRQPRELRAMLESHFASAISVEPEEPEEEASELFPKRTPQPRITPESRQRIAHRVAAAERVLYLGEGSCRQCHRFQPEPATLAPNALADLKVAPTKIPDVWFKHALFDHSAHRALDCRECHAGADDQDAQGHPNPNVSVQSKDCLIPKKEVCAACHAPRKVSAGAVRGGLDYSCVRCHRYHGHASQQSLNREDAQSGVSIDDYLMGP